MRKMTQFVEFSHYKSNYNINTISQQNSCVCCLNQDIAFVKLATCKHASIIQILFKFKMEFTEYLICYSCHNLLKKMELFRQQVEESVAILNGQSFNLTPIAKINKLVQSELEITSTTDCHPIAVEIANEPTNQSPVIKTEVEIEYDPSDFGVDDVPLSEIKKEMDTAEVKTEKDLGEYSCPICKTVMPSMDLWNAHCKEHKKWEPIIKNGPVNKLKARLQCTECDKTFRHRAALKNHKVSVHELHNSFPCSQCDKVFSWKAALSRHMEERHRAKSNATSAAFCASCNISFTSVRSYRRHMKYTLKHVTQDQFKYICDHCNRRFPNKTKLRDHIEEKHLYKKFQCHICTKPLKNRVGLDHHIRYVHQPRRYNKICQYCNKAFPTKVQLDAHIRSHTGERPFKCKYCPTTCSQRSNLYKHVKLVHLKKKPTEIANKSPEDKANSHTESNQTSTDSPRPVALYYTSDTGFVSVSDII